MPTYASASPQQWDETYFKNLPDTQIFELIHASNYLGIDSLLTASCKAVARALIKRQSSLKAGSEAIRDYVRLTTTTNEAETYQNDMSLDQAACRVCLVPELRDRILLERSCLENQSLRQDWVRLKGRTEWSQRMDQNLTWSLEEVPIVTRTEKLFRGGKTQAILDQENTWLQAELERIRSNFRLEIHNAFSRFSGR